MIICKPQLWDILCHILGHKIYLMAFFVTSCQHSSLRVYTFVKKTKSVGNSSFGFIAENLTIVPIKVLYMLLGQRSRVRFPPCLAKFSACLVWMHTQSNTSNIILEYIDIEGTRLSSEISPTRTDLTSYLSW